MYCVKCGVELAESEEKCPLCNTPVYYPAHKRGELTFPALPAARENLSPRGLYFIISVLFAIAAIISVICNISVSRTVSWSSYVIAALVLIYTVAVLPGWFRHPSPAVFVPVDFGTVALFLAFIDLRLRGGWFLSFALPLVASAALITCSVVILSHYLRRGYLYIYGGASIAFGFFVVLVELLLNLRFSLHSTLVWSFYPFAVCFLLGLMLIVIAIVPPFRESLRKIFAL